MVSITLLSFQTMIVVTTYMIVSDILQPSRNARILETIIVQEAGRRHLQSSELPLPRNACTWPGKIGNTSPG